MRSFAVRTAGSSDRARDRRQRETCRASGTKFGCPRKVDDVDAAKARGVAHGPGQAAIELTGTNGRRNNHIAPA